VKENVEKLNVLIDIDHVEDIFEDKFFIPHIKSGKSMI
jgi:hypothetical protein